MWKLLKVRVRTLLTEAIFLLLIQVAKGVRDANAHVYYLVIVLLRQIHHRTFGENPFSLIEHSL